MAGEGTSTSTGSAIDLNAPEIVAVVNDRVARETAELRTRAETAEANATAAQTRIDVLEAEKVAAEQAKVAAETAMAALQSEVENERASVSRRESRTAALREVAAHLTDEWFGQEVAAGGDTKIARIDKIARMSDEEFASYKAEIASAFEGVVVAPAQGGSNSGANPPRETAMAGSSASGNGGTGASTVKPSTKFLSGVRV